MRSSEQIDQLADALCKAQAEFPTIPKLHQAKIPTKNGGEYRYNYADLSDTVDAARPVLEKHGLAVAQMPGFDGHDLLSTRVMHSSGQWIEDDMRLFLTADSPQAQGSAITYARRYAYCAALGIVADEDDDGASATHRQQPQGVASQQTATARAIAQTTAVPATPDPSQASVKQTNLIRVKMKDQGITEDLAVFGKATEILGKPVKSLADLSVKEASTVIDAL